MHNPWNECLLVPGLTMFVIAEIPPPTTSPTTTAIPTDSSTPIGWKNTPATTRRQNHTKNRKKGLILNGKYSFFASIASSSKLQGRRHRKNQRNLGDVHFTDRRQATSFAAGEDMGEANTLIIAMQCWVCLLIGLQYVESCISDSATGLDERGLNTSQSSKLFLHRVMSEFLVVCAYFTSYRFA